MAFAAVRVDGDLIDFLELAGAKYSEFMGAEFGGDVVGPEVEVGEAEDVFALNAEGAREAAVVEDDAAFRIFEIAEEGAAIHEGLESAFADGKAVASGLGGSECVLKCGALLAEFEARVDLASEDAKSVELIVVEMARNLVDDAEGAKSVAVRAGDREAGIKADVRVAADQGVGREARVLMCVRDDEDVGLLNRVVAESDAARALLEAEAGGGFVPLVGLIQQGHEPNGGATDGGGELDELAELGLVRGVQEIKSMERCEAVCFIDGNLFCN
jgi:hypothetical protein